MRLFVAVMLSDENQRRLRASINALVQAQPNVLRAIPEGTAHLTLVFMGRAGESDVEGIQSAMREVARPRGPMTIELAGARVLRARQDPRLVLLPVSAGAGQMIALARDLQRAMATRVPSLELSSAKDAHVTLARFRKHARAADGRAVEQALATSGIASLVLREDVGDIRLIESAMTPSGPQYAGRFTAPLAADA
jgi:2'-5' RNA ligase